MKTSQSTGRNSSNYSNSEREKNIRENNKEDKKKVLKKKRIRNRKKHWLLFILAPSNPTNEYQVASRVSLTTHIHKKCDLFM